jgi:hypothetical protein
VDPFFYVTHNGTSASRWPGGAVTHQYYSSEWLLIIG